jgi:ATP-dependent RNA helicase DeaD
MTDTLNETKDTETTSTTPPEAEVDTAAFAALGLGADALRAIQELGFSAPTPIQEQIIPLLLAGTDVIAQAPTGTGKTAAYGLPIVEHLDVNELRPQALVVVPTRELSIQVAEALHGLGRFRELVTLPIYGGAPYDRQLRALRRGVQAVVGTPGRLLDHLNRGTLDLSGVRTMVLDEADEMLNMGFIEDIEAILAALPKERQTGLFSATIPPRIARLAAQYLREPQHIAVAAREAVAPRVRQVYYEVPWMGKSEALARILDLEAPESAIVFVRTRVAADEVAEQLAARGYLAQAIHGEIGQAQRERVLERFRKGHTQLLVATDVAARGLDIPDVSHIINYDLPLDAESYVHRIGRTGRAGRGGEALTLVTPREIRMLRNIEHAIHRRLERLRLPTLADVAASRRAAFRDDVMNILDAGALDPFLALVEDLSGTHDPAEIAAAAFKMAVQARDATRPGSADAWLRPAPEAEPAASAGTEAPAAAGDEQGRPGKRRETRQTEPTTRARRDRRRSGERMARLFLRVGKRDGVRPADVVGAIANEAGIPGDEIGDIDLYDNFTFVEVPEGAAETVRAALNRTTIRGKQPRADIALPESVWDQQGERGDTTRPYYERSFSGDGRRPPRAPTSGRLKAATDRKGAGRAYGGKATRRGGPPSRSS